MPSLKKGNKVEYWMNGEKFVGEIISRAGKVSGQYKHRYNIKEEDDTYSIDLQRAVEKWKKIDNDENECLIL